MRLGINIDHVATIRNARGGVHPNPVKAAEIAANAGADGITAHLREDRRHISDIDIKNLKESIELPLNLEMAPTEEMLNIALEARPERVCLVPEKRLELTTEGGLETVKLEDKKKRIIQNIIKECNNYNINVSLFIDPNLEQIMSVIDLGANIIELHTGEYCNSSNPIKELIRIDKAAEFATNNNIEVHAGHGLNFNNVIDIAKIKYIKELNIGHFIIGESIFMGLEGVVKKMKNIIDGCK